MRGGWKTAKIEDIAQVINGGTPKTKVPEYWDGDHLWITPAEMGKLDSPYIESSRRKLTDAGLKNSSASLLPKKSVILSTRAPIGHLVINTEPMAFNQGCRGLIPCGEVHYKYLYYFLYSSVELLNELGSGTTFKELSAGKLKKVKILVPPLPEQKRIVAILDEAFAGIATVTANTEKNLANARELFESYLNAVFTQPGEGWVNRPLGDVCTFQGGSQPPKSAFSKEQLDDYVRLIQIRDYKSDKYKVYIPKSLARRFCSADEIMIGRYGPPLFQILRGIEGAYNVALMKAIPREGILSKDYLYYFLKNRNILDYVIHASSRAAGQAGINKATLEPYPIVFPVSLHDQQKIVEKLNLLLQETTRVESNYLQKVEALAELKQSLLQKAFSGELTTDKEVSNAIRKADEIP